MQVSLWAGFDGKARYGPNQSHAAPLSPKSVYAYDIYTVFLV